MSEIMNARIVSTTLGLEDHGIFTCYLRLEYGDGVAQSFGGYELDQYNDDAGMRRDFNGSGLEFIRSVIDVVGVADWEALKGQLVRLRFDSNSASRRIESIGNALQDKWFSPAVFFNRYYPKKGN